MVQNLCIGIIYFYPNAYLKLIYLALNFQYQRFFNTRGRYFHKYKIMTYLKTRFIWKKNLLKNFLTYKIIVDFPIYVRLSVYFKRDFLSTNLKKCTSLTLFRVSNNHKHISLGENSDIQKYSSEYKSKLLCMASVMSCTQKY